jgi:hypothetical protein
LECSGHCKIRAGIGGGICPIHIAICTAAMRVR